MREKITFKVQTPAYAVRLSVSILLLASLFLRVNAVYSQSPAGLITNINGGTGHSYTLAGLVEGTTIYSDRTYLATDVPSFLNNAPFIKTPNDDKGNKSTTAPSFTLTQASTVYVAYDPRVTVLPSWLSSWQKLATQVGINDPNISGLTLYSKNFPSGTVTLGGNLASPAAGALNMYLIMAVPQSGFTVSVTTSGSGTVSRNPNQATYAGGSSVILTATPASGQQFTGWGGDASGTTNPLTVTVNSNKNITANFTQTSSGLITNIAGTSGHPYTQGTLVAGTTAYTDRTYQVTDIPAFLNSAPFIKTPNDDKTSTAASILSFNLTQGAVVYIAYDPRATSLPGWLSDWQKLSSVVGINDPKVPGMTLYSKTFAAGKVTLGGNLASPAAGALNNYFVIASAQASQYTLTTNTNGNGTLTKNPNQASYPAGSGVVLTATPASGQQFTGWSGNATGTVNPLTVTMDANKSITANFATGSGTPAITTSPLKIYDNEVSGGAAGIPRKVAVINNGVGVLSLSSVNLSGANTNQFALSGLPSFPKNINSGDTITFSVTFNPTSVGLKTVLININSNDPLNPSISVPVRGLGTVGLGGNNEPSLQALLDLLEIQATVGDDNAATTVIHSNTNTQKSALLGDEVSIQKFQKAGAGNVTIIPLGVFGPTANNPVLGTGWYKSGDAASKSELFTVSNSPASNGQTVNVNYTGTLSFDPASASFGFYCRWPFFSNRLMFSEDNLNTFTGAVPHHVRIFPYKKNGVIIQNSYLVTFEDNTTSLDYNDLVFLVTNVKKFVPKTTASNALLFVENTDAFPSNEHVVFSRIQNPWTRDSVYNDNHDSIKIRLRNYGINPLIISDLKISAQAYWKIDKLSGADFNPSAQLPATVSPGGTLDLMVKFIATDVGTSTNNRVRLLHETLTISSNDDVSPDKVVYLDGLWQRYGEGVREPYSHEILEIFGYGTNTGFTSHDPDKGDSTKIKGDEIKPDYFLRADTTKPITVRQLNAHHGCCYLQEYFKWFPRGNPSDLFTLFRQTATDGQTLLPRRSLGGSPAGGTFIPTGAFGILIGPGNSTVPALNTDKKLGTRVYKAYDASHNIIPDTYILAGDYLGPESNYDYNDNMYYITNLKPAVGTVYYSLLNTTPSDLDFGEHVLQTTSSMTLNISSAGKTYSNGSQDPPIIISSVVISGENASEFSADMPLLTTLNPQQGTTINVKFNPESQGLKIADLLIYYNNFKSPKRVPLYGIGKAAGVTVTANFRINSGATSSTTFEGKTWAADNQYAHDNLEPYKNSAVKQIEATDEDFLYLVEQSSSGDKKPFRYQFPLNNGNYHVRLHFAEIYWGFPGLGLAGGVGSRIFSVKIENQYRLANYDITADVGGGTAVIKNFPVTVTDGNLNIDFSATLNRPLVMAVEVYSFSGSSVAAGAVTTTQNEPALISQRVAPGATGKPVLYPNPLVNKTFNIRFPALYQGDYTIHLNDMLGRKYDLGKKTVNSGGSNMKVNISKLSLKPGVYFLKINSPTNKTDVLKLLIK